MTSGIVIAKDPETGVYNASYHRLQLLGPDRTGIKLDLGRHLRLAWERAKARNGRASPIVVVPSAPISRFNTPPPPWARRCRRTPTSWRSLAACADARFR